MESLKKYENIEKDNVQRNVDKTMSNTTASQPEEP